jgi:hypothetical protein
MFNYIGGRCERGKRMNKRTNKCEPPKSNNISRKNSSQLKMNSNIYYDDKTAYLQLLSAIRANLASKKQYYKVFLDKYSAKDKKLLKKYEMELNMDPPADGNRFNEFLENEIETARKICTGEISHSNLTEGYLYYDYCFVLKVFTQNGTMDDEQQFPNIKPNITTILDNLKP